MDGTHSLAGLRDFEAIRFCLEEDEVARIVVDRRGLLLWRSRAAALLLQGDCPLVDRAGKLGGVDRRAQQFLNERLDEAFAGEEICQFMEAEQGTRFLLRMRPVDEDGERAVVITLKDFEAPVHIPRLERLFGLSAMEARILQLIIEGASAERIADSKAISILTVRTHIKHIHSKMDVRSKEEILAVIVKIFA
jgi:DNA-binding CsgD family transcriptional regulator